MVKNQITSLKKELTLNLELFFGLESERKKMGKEQRSDWLAYLKQVLGRSLISARYSIEGLC
ncbi:hypothetical protein [Streptococcus equi]|uniref:hypothetical protein n=1 Tax=Streptococcus equi TaxID=1336 RepID=UPI000E1C3696|nr:hypothetical protein [Streptococcus equi]MDI6029634.1 hypothetical protein [Streptococcus equi subsp. zooepidemicus]HEL0192570.1 hypothetical protein [Streptococcus equi subsp. zooepidemicus]HEL0593132.1 hypothetical protein [Streptococcus equi subsp. zooepidemicus]HEL1021308.1 hypothetical protein [Streptococcus equi subsp. zooepidemicus]HEL1059040.1 hypothetical protein [Streptococcus equi subsp. zooepidemicus]